MFSKAGALKKAMGGPIRRAAGRAAPQSVPAASTSTKKEGALGLVGRIAPQSQKNPRSKRGHHMMSTDALSGTDATLAETGDGLRKIVGRMSRGRIAAAKGGKIGKYAEGGKVGTAMSALRALAKKYQAALESGDLVLARRLKKQLDSEGVKDPEEEVGNQKAATFAKGGKVRALQRLGKLFRARMDDKEGYIREGFGKTREEARAKLREEVAYDNGEDTVDALLEEHGVTYKRSKE